MLTRAAFPTMNGGMTGRQKAVHSCDATQSRCPQSRVLTIGRAYQTAAMTEHYYPVLQVPDSGIDPEDEPERLGSKRKFWFRREDGRRCLFKFPRRDFGEHWAEKVAAEVASLIGVRRAEVQVARFGDVLGTQSPAFAEPEWLRVHGNEVMAEAISGYDGSRDTGRGDHSIRNIALAVNRWAERNGLDPPGNPTGAGVLRHFGRPDR